MSDATMFESILVGVDGSASSRDAIALATRLADPTTTVALVHVHRGERSPRTGAQPTLLKGTSRASTELLEDERAKAGVSAELLSVAAMSVASGLHQEAERGGADLLVVGSSRHAALGRAMLGDHTRASLNGAPCAVAIAARGYGDTKAEIASIGVAYDGSPESEAALEAARALASITGATIGLREVVVIHTPGSGTASSDVGASAEKTFSEAADRIEVTPGVSGKAVYGSAGEELDAFSEQVDILLLGSRGYGPLKRLMLGSTSNHLASHAGCCLLVLPRIAIERDDSFAVAATAAVR